MSAIRIKYYKGLFLAAAVYDLVLGVVFTLFYRAAFELLGIRDKLPDYGAYVSLLGAFLMVIGVAYYLIYHGDLIKNRDLILVGTLYKLAYCATGLFYFIFSQVPHLIFVFVFGVADLIMFIMMMECYLYLGKAEQETSKNA
jgi:hypothetical protein